MRNNRFKGIVSVVTAILIAGMLTACGGNNAAGPVNNGERDRERVDEEQNVQTGDLETNTDDQAEFDPMDPNFNDDGSESVDSDDTDENDQSEEDKQDQEPEPEVKSFDIKDAFPFYNGYAWVKYINEDNHLTVGLIDEDANLIYTEDNICEYDRVGAAWPYFQSGVTYVNIGNDLTSRVEKEEECFDGGMYEVAQSKAFVIIDESGNELYRSPEGECEDYSVYQHNDRFLVGAHVTSMTEDKYVYYVIDKNGNRVFDDNSFELDFSSSDYRNKVCGVLGNKYFAVYSYPDDFSFIYNIEDGSIINLGDGFSFLHLGYDGIVASKDRMLIAGTTNGYDYDWVVVDENDLVNQETFDNAKAERTQSGSDAYSHIKSSFKRISTHGVYLEGSADNWCAKNVDGTTLFDMITFGEGVRYTTLQQYAGDHAVLNLCGVDEESYKTVIDEEGNIGYDPIKLDDVIGSYNGYIFTKEMIISPTGEQLSYGDKLDGIDKNTRVYYNQDNTYVLLSGGFFMNSYFDGSRTYTSLDGRKIDKIFVKE